jgi:small subunit ribosomal protein S3
MGQKTNPIGFRLGIVKTWDSRWFAKKGYAEMLQEDLLIKRYLKKRLFQAGISRITIERKGDKITIGIKTARPGLVIGRKGEQVDKLSEEMKQLTKKQVQLNIEEIKRADLDAQLVAEHIAKQLEQRVSFRRAMKKAIASSMRAGAKGIRVAASGRLGGAEMARFETYREGRVPLHTLRADIDYGFAEARTTYGVIGIKVWVFKGEVMAHNAEPAQAPAPAPEQPKRPPRRTPPGAKHAATN